MLYKIYEEENNKEYHLEIVDILNLIKKNDKNSSKDFTNLNGIRCVSRRYF